MRGGGYHLPCSTFQLVSSTFSLCNTDSFFFLTPVLCLIHSSPLFLRPHTVISVIVSFIYSPPPAALHSCHPLFCFIIIFLLNRPSSPSFTWFPPASFSFLMYFSIQCRRLQKAQLVQVCTSKTPFLPQLQLWGLVLLHQLSFSSPIIIITSIFTHLFVETTSEKRNLLEVYESQLLNHLLFCSSSVLFPARPLKCVHESEVDFSCFYSSGSSTQKINK